MLHDEEGSRQTQWKAPEEGWIKVSADATCPIDNDVRSLGLVLTNHISEMAMRCKTKNYFFLSPFLLLPPSFSKYLSYC